MTNYDYTCIGQLTLSLAPEHADAFREFVQRDGLTASTARVYLAHVKRLLAIGVGSNGFDAAAARAVADTNSGMCAAWNHWRNYAKHVLKAPADAFPPFTASAAPWLDIDFVAQPLLLKALGFIFRMTTHEAQALRWSHMDCERGAIFPPNKAKAVASGSAVIEALRAFRAVMQPAHAESFVFVEGPGSDLRLNFRAIGSLRRRVDAATLARANNLEAAAKAAGAPALAFDAQDGREQLKASVEAAAAGEAVPLADVLPVAAPVKQSTDYWIRVRTIEVMGDGTALKESFRRSICGEAPEGAEKRPKKWTPNKKGVAPGDKTLPQKND